MGSIKNLLSLVSIQGFGALLSLVYVVILTSVLGTENFGKYAWVVSIGGVLSLIFQRGLPTSILKIYAPFDISSLKSPSSVTRTLGLYFLSASIVLLVTTLLTPIIAYLPQIELLWSIPIGISLACTTIADAVLRSANLALKAQVANQIIRTMLLLIGVGFLFCFSVNNIIFYFMTYCVASLLSAAIFIYPALRSFRKSLMGSKGVRSNSAHFQVSMSRSIGNHLPIFITGFFVIPETLAYLAIAIRLTAPIGFGVIASRAYFGARINKKLKEKKYSSAYRDFKLSAIFSFGIAIIASLFIYTAVIYLSGAATGPLSEYNNIYLLNAIFILVILFKVCISGFGPVQIVAILQDSEIYVRNYNLFALSLFSLGLIIAGKTQSILMSGIVMVVYGMAVSMGLWWKVRSNFLSSSE
ncbi:oligosaccharide flippase family protein [Cobetia sp. UIB-001]|uniref:lipopolysaccharide biosynthesis protein n=1 Tax=Cobetia sp. UIB-001 TaxID=2717697 RepID=UPI00384FD807